MVVPAGRCLLFVCHVRKNTSLTTTLNMQRLVDTLCRSSAFPTKFLFRELSVVGDVFDGKGLATT